MTIIALLSDDVISQIAAGEVVERPASVVKELIENALDAGAKNIHVEATRGGRKSIRISDDGSGILGEEVELAITRHATSKLRSADDLERIQTLGFRGEALSSIAAVSRFQIATRHRNEDVGTQIRVEGGTVTDNKPIGAPAGTVISVNNLFFNVPARLKFLKSENTEKRHINAIVQNYAMAYPDVRFVLSQDGREQFRSPGSGQLGDVVVKVLGLDYFREMLEVSAQDKIREQGGTVSVYGFVSQPTLHRKDRTRITLFVNGRAVQDSGLTYAVTQAYHTLIEKGRNPYAVLMIDVPPDFVDVNVHPTKAEVRFQDTSVVFAAVQRTVRQGVLGYAQAARHSKFGATQSDDLDESGWALPYDRKRQMDMGLPLDYSNEHDRLPSVDSTAYQSSDPTAIPVGMGQPAKPRTLPLLRVVGQVGAAYIVAEGPAGMYLIDQHAAHSRVIYQELTDLFAQNDTLPHRQLESITVDLSSGDTKLLEKHVSVLEKCGFLLEPFGSNTYLMRGIPAALNSGEPASHLWHMLEILGTKPQDTQEALLIAIAGRAAIKSGQILSLEDMKSLVRKLERCPDPHSSPAGQATLIHMSAQELQREFSRTQS
ncbi:MAG: DNA mismatch repair endonuclease MutL [Chloroflexota bacterium]